jgi:acyl-CoA hydrolase
MLIAMQRCAFWQVEESEFLNPVYLGQAVFINAKVAFASERSVNVVVDVLAKNLLNGDMTIAHTSKVSAGPHIIRGWIDMHGGCSCTSRQPP